MEARTPDPCWPGPKLKLRFSARPAHSPASASGIRHSESAGGNSVSGHPVRRQLSATIRTVDRAAELAGVEKANVWSAVRRWRRAKGPGAAWWLIWGAVHWLLEGDEWAPICRSSQRHNEPNNWSRAIGPCLPDQQNHQEPTASAAKERQGHDDSKLSRERPAAESPF
ncbi:predicted protein [Chaetomium globosum CBS 148.51]|uniref:Uncharacterized protein n=1 Tax=Chaetomium globosum (strain ATCC 6205 / CBS 148.51 / DSM 1962 / NBRC 6347 / NRRL 1970) TaxID=306901 RepID=Q2HCN9_CHAGB|nr:uncharacterized protein CHGG_02015 [Chaetomium globosum CBS 148.51]EAQ93780.1 predicted protein [Chaetomium globosum CBS 148.51]